MLFGGVVVSLLVQAIKKLAGTSKFVTITTTVILSIIGGFLYSWLNTSGMWEQALNILAYAGGFYAFIVKSLESK